MQIHVFTGSRAQNRDIFGRVSIILPTTEAVIFYYFFLCLFTYKDPPADDWLREVCLLSHLLIDLLFPISLCQRCHDLASLSSHYSWFQDNSVNSTAGGVHGNRHLGPCKFTRGKLLFNSTPIIRVFKRLRNDTLKVNESDIRLRCNQEPSGLFGAISHTCFRLSQEARERANNQKRTES